MNRREKHVIILCDQSSFELFETFNKVHQNFKNKNKWTMGVEQEMILLPTE